MNVKYHRFGTINRTVPRAVPAERSAVAGAVCWGVDVQGCRPNGWCRRCGAEVFRRGEEMCERCGGTNRFPPGEAVSEAD